MQAVTLAYRVAAGIYFMVDAPRRRHIVHSVPSLNINVYSLALLSKIITPVCREREGERASVLNLLVFP